MNVNTKNSIFQVTLSVSPDGFLRFGDTIMLLNTRGSEHDPCDPCALSIIADLSNIASHLETNSKPYLQGPCQVGGASSLQPCVRNAFIITRYRFSSTYEHRASFIQLEMT